MLLPVVVHYLSAWLCNAQMCDYTTLYFMHSTINGHLDSFQVLPMTNSVAMNILAWYVSFGEHVGSIPRGRIAGSKVYVCSVLVEAAKKFSKVMVTIDVPTSSDYSISSLTLDIFCLFHFSHSGRCIVLLHCGFKLHFCDY